ncbi:MAG: hypothetical protein M1825_002831 [Sarcosagium campestre]|nr:MAG: hypothetical protein M1825_002831 [Sarcosagium campestre]
MPETSAGTVLGETHTSTSLPRGRQQSLVTDSFLTFFIDHSIAPRSQQNPPDEFSSDWADKPFILSSVVDRWPVYSSWSLDSLLQQYGNVSFTAEAVDWPMRLYAQYMAYNGDESPLYLFDRDFVRKMQLQIATPHASKRDSHAYWIPDCFGEDLFAVLGDKRPDCQWLIIGPARSGSTFHKDPNATSAWNAVLKGSKYWIMFPPSDRLPPPPGVLVSEDHSEVTSPLSIAEWLLGFHAQARATKGCKEGVCAAGEVLHVPSGWWHLVVNLETSIAITQNFVPAVHLPAAIRFLRDKPDQVSGFNTAEVEDPYKEFMQRLEQTHPSLLENALEMMNASSIGKKRRWDEVAGKSLDAGYADRGFSFGFSSDDDDETIDIP